MAEALYAEFDRLCLGGYQPQQQQPRAARRPRTPSIKIGLEIESRRVLVKWRCDCIGDNGKFRVVLREENGQIHTKITLPHLPPNSRDVELEITPGDTYSIHIEGWLETHGSRLQDCDVFSKREFKAVYSKLELKSLRSLAQHHTSQCDMEPTDWFIRHKPPSYFKDISRHKGNIMIPYIKDNNGDQASPINNMMDGLFFSTKHMTGPSPFGTSRFMLPAAQYFDRNKRLYFTDFYCKPNSNPHYVTLVMTTKDSAADDFCRPRLVELDPRNNEFLCKLNGQVFVLSSRTFHVELLITDEIDLSYWSLVYKGSLTHGHSSTGTSRPGGIPKDTTCNICNLY